MPIHDVFSLFLFLTTRNTALINRNHKSIHPQLKLRKLNKEKKSHKPQRASPSRVLLFNARRKFYFGSFISFMNFLCLQTMPRKMCVTDRNSLSIVVDSFRGANVDVVDRQIGRPDKINVSPKSGRA